MINQSVSAIVPTRRAFPDECDLRRLLDATCLFAQYECGSGFCFHPTGLVMTCAHCVVDDDESADASDFDYDEDDEADEKKRHNPETVEADALGTMKTLIFGSGLLVVAECISIDVYRDAAVLKVIYAHSDELEALRQQKES